MISVICPVYNEEKYILKCIESLLHQDYPKEETEILFIDGMSTDFTRDLIKSYVTKYSFIHLLDNPAKIVPAGMNIGIRAAKGEIIVRIDAHALFPRDYLSVLVKKLVTLQAANVGGLCKTLPANKSSTALAIAVSMSSVFGMGNSYFRIGSKIERSVDTVPFGCFHKSLFDKIGYFDEELVRNQDDELNGRILKNNGMIFLIPDLVIDYYARDKVSKVSRMFYQYGLFKPLVNKKLGSPATLRQFFPPLFVAGLILGLILSFVGKTFLIVYASVLVSYMLLSLYFSFIEVLKHKNNNLVILLPYLFFVIHFSYGWGYLMGIIRFLILRNTKANLTLSR